MCQKLDKLVSQTGYHNADDLFEHTNFFIVNTIPGICTRPDCDHMTDIEPDQDHGFCEVCGANTVKSALVLAGFI